jgi:hypothetical protein
MSITQLVMVTQVMPGGGANTFRLFLKATRGSVLYLYLSHHSF